MRGDIPLIPHTPSWFCRLPPYCCLFARTAQNRVSVLLYILEVTSSVLGPEAVYNKNCRGIIQFIQVNPTIIYYFQICKIRGSHCVFLDVTTKNSLDRHKNFGTSAASIFRVRLLIHLEADCNPFIFYHLQFIFLL